MKTNTHYTCACCKETFEKGWSDEEADAEREELFPDMTEDDCELVCDGCFEKIMGKADENNPTV